MPVADSTAAVATHYYKVARLQLVSYSIYTTTDAAPDQVLLELELRIRHDHPRVLVTYNNKCLYHFRLGHWPAANDCPGSSHNTPGSGHNNPGSNNTPGSGHNNPGSGHNNPGSNNTNDPAGPADLPARYPQLTRKHHAVVSAEQLASPAAGPRPRSGTPAGAPAADEHLPYASLLFAKAVKKLLVYNVAAGGQMHMFGNHVAARTAPGLAQYRVVQMDPVLLAGGELWVLVTQRARLPLFDLGVVSLDHVTPGFAACFAIYVVPAGLRCHLYDPHNVRRSFTATPPRSAPTLMRLLKASTGVELAAKPRVVWAKLVPNLQHLNSHTSPVARFVHDVDNRKYILWPWELCMLQFGSADVPPRQTARPPPDPMALLDAYWAHALSAPGPGPPAAGSTPTRGLATAALAPVETGDPFSVPSGASGAQPGVLSAGHAMLPLVFLGHVSAAAPFGDAPDLAFPFVPSDGGKNDIDIDIDNKNDIDIVNDNDNDNDANDNKNDNKNDNDNKIENNTNTNTNTNANDNKNDIKNDNDIGNSGSDDDLFGASSDLDARELPDGSAGSAPPGEPLPASQNTPPRASASPMRAKEDSPRPAGSAAYLGIPRNEMIHADIRQFTPGSYDDPGAPPPLVPTPAVAQHGVFGGFPGLLPLHAPQNTHLQPPASAHRLARRDRRHLDSAAAWAFSPIVFNPKIKNSIDTKYGKGGKFYVDTEESSGPELEPRRPRLRETSVLAYDLNVLKDSAAHLPTRVSDSSLSAAEGKDGDTATGRRPATAANLPPELASNVDLDMLSAESDHDVDSDDDNDDGADDDEIESDEDEDDSTRLPFSDLNGATLKLNTHVGDLFDTAPSQDAMQDPHPPPELAVSAHFPFSGANSVLISPGTAQINPSRTNKDSSPFGLGIDTHAVSLSPLPVSDMKPDVNPGVASEPLDPLPSNKDILVPEASNTPSSSSSTSSGVSESSNCLPLILRSINTQSIPNMFLLNKVPGAWGTVSMAGGFDMDADDEEDDIEHKDAGLSVKVKHMDELLNWLMPNLVFDLGLTDFERHTQLRLPDFFSEEVLTGLTDSSASQETARIFKETFPQSHVVTLNELLVTPSTSSSAVSLPALDSKAPLPFLDEMTMDMNEGSLNFASPSADASLLYWDSFIPNASIGSGVSGSEKRRTGKFDEKSVVVFDEVKVQVCKNQKDIINLNILGTRFWKYFNFSPINGPKKFQVLMLTENHLRHDKHFSNTCGDAEFLDMLKYNYMDMRLGSVKTLNLQTFETRPDLEGISNGILMIDKDLGDRSYNDFYKRANRKLKNLAELIKLDLINRTNRFEFDRPLLLLFIDFGESINSVLQIAKICRNFKVNLNNHQLSLVEVFAHVIPSSHLFKKSSSGCYLKYLSDSKLAKISTTIYNKCPNTHLVDLKLPVLDREEPRKLYSQLVKDTPTSINFKFLSRLGKESLNSDGQDDMFLHVAYERSVDKNWICAAWSDPLGIVTHMRSWYCPPSAKAGSDKDVHDLGSIIFKIWEISNNLFKKLNEDILQRICGSSKKKFLVLARVSSIIPDDELLHWKRLTAKYKDISLIVLTTNRLPKYLFKSASSNGHSMFDETHNETKIVLEAQGNVSENTEKKSFKSEGSDFIQSFDAFPATHSSTSPLGGIAMSASPMNNALTFHSPQQFLNAPSSIYLPPDGRLESMPNDADCTLKDTSFDIVGVIPRVALPSCNSPTRYSMRTGYLVKESLALKNLVEKEYVVFEFSLLSCSNYWNLDNAMKITLKQFKKLVMLNDILGVYDRAAVSMDDSRKARQAELQTLVPWHINAVVKALDYLVHVHVEE
ncbi:hypothetical protein METBIDRAFT_205895 [Metschnikowia bicuspidata var. bicuspidata NRRL YB-4993]|uniref:Mediator of RNA polymerase II transcription subunit 13 n=1 Tax=Metschnikowia bicuspidata var. bicuspidata NRRL YB-4993 TaxID=869754 RepID=A0A1A0HA94_9ASCO|nr:hypothetical protein METBIDRAFT_205895 [Metschnikowia bicuspidata var. bicuspidata NRRL YB-4993]OBA20797.1 hypothetical protein METBIDRAFT_205895 [Metschnikowia bicuspidata var. bicuspidata NRRL YB-4993]